VRIDQVFERSRYFKREGKKGGDDPEILANHYRPVVLSEKLKDIWGGGGGGGGGGRSKREDSARSRRSVEVVRDHIEVT
jgi:hypothetical protein